MKEKLLRFAVMLMACFLGMAIPIIVFVIIKGGR